MPRALGSLGSRRVIKITLIGLLLSWLSLSLFDRIFCDSTDEETTDEEDNNNNNQEEINKEVSVIDKGKGKDVLHITNSTDNKDVELNAKAEIDEGVKAEVGVSEVVNAEVSVPEKAKAEGSVPEEDYSPTNIDGGFVHSVLDDSEIPLIIFG